jgi:hypothetical protein
MSNTHTRGSSQWGGSLRAAWPQPASSEIDVSPSRQLGTTRSPGSREWQVPYSFLIFKKKKKKSRVVVAHTFNLSTWEAETGGFLSSRPAWSTKSSRTAKTIQRNPVLKNQKKKKKERALSTLTQRAGVWFPASNHRATQHPASKGTSPHCARTHRQIQIPTDN